MSAGTDAKPTATIPKRIRAPFGSREFYVSKLEEVLEVVASEPLPFAALIERLRTIWSDTDRQLLLERLEQMAPPGGRATRGCRNGADPPMSVRRPARATR